MITVVQTVAGASQFTGLAGAGLIDFAELALAGEGESGIVYNLALKWTDGGAVAGTTINCFFQRPAGGATERLQVTSLVDTAGFELAGCRIIVPREFPGLGAIWPLQLITTGKTVDASLIISFGKGRVETGPG